MSSIINSNDSSLEPKKWMCPICRNVFQSSTSMGLITKRAKHLKEHGIRTSDIPPDKRYNDKHILLLFKALNTKRIPR